MSQWTNITGVIKTRVHTNNSADCDKRIREILGKEWTGWFNKSMIPKEEDRKLPEGSEGSLHYDILCKWQFEYDENNHPMNKWLEYVIVVFYGELRDDDGSELKEWFEKVVNEIGKMPLEVRSSVLRYDVSGEDYTHILTSEWQWDSDWNQKRYKIVSSQVEVDDEKDR